MFDTDTQSRQGILQKLNTALESFYAETAHLPVSQVWQAASIRQKVQAFDFNQTHKPEEVIEAVIQGLTNYAVHTPHPQYYGLFNPRSGFIAAIADYITAIFNPQLAAWSHAPYANEVERYIIQAFGEKFAYPASSLDGTFCTGGAESNLTALLCALNHHFPNYRKEGLQSLAKEMRIYCSSESHHSVLRAAQVVGLGSNAVVEAPVNAQFQMHMPWLAERIQMDLAAGHRPVMLVATAGTTGLGAMDDLKTSAQLCKKYRLWFHVDAAYGGAMIVSPKTRAFLEGIELSDSITLDLHKWFSLPMGASLFLSTHPQILPQTFGLYTEYMPKKETQASTIDPYTHSIQWSRRFIGLKMYLPLAIYGWSGFEKIILHQIEMGHELRNQLQAKGWQIENNSPLPIICFSHPSLHQEHIEKILDIMIERGDAWLSLYPVNGKRTLRACITNYNTQKDDLIHLVKILEQLKKEYITAS